MSNIEIHTDRSKLDIDLIYNFLSNSYWANKRTKEEVKISIENSICFGVYENNIQIGLARVVSDTVVFGYIMDFFILESHQGKGIGKFLMKEILTSPGLRNVESWYLVTKDAQTLYQKFGFEEFNKPDKTVMYVNKQNLILS